MLLRLDLESGVPLYLQITQQVRRLIASGTLAPGDQLPTVRELAAELVVNPNTVARAYRDLEHDGVVETRRGQGTFACAPSRTLAIAERREIIAAHLDRALLEARSLGVPDEQVTELLDERIQQMRRAHPLEEKIHEPEVVR